MPQPSDLARYYGRYSYDDPAAWLGSPATEQALSRLARTFDSHRITGRLLDVGCGAGQILRAMSAAGWTVEGTEISFPAIHRLRQEGFTIHEGLLPSLDLPFAAYDVAVASELLEHLPDPLAHLARLRTCVRPGGVLYLTTPNYGSLSRRVLGNRWRAICPPEHLVYLERASLLRLMRASGFDQIRVQAENLDPGPLLRAFARAQSAPETARGPGHRQEALRLALARHSLLSLLKGVLNATLAALRWGDTLKCLARNPGPPGTE